jgi:hypothetical protein
MTDKAIEAAFKMCESQFEDGEISPKSLAINLIQAYEAAKGDGWLPISELPDINRLSVLAKLRYSDHYQIILNIDGDWWDEGEITDISIYTHFQHLPTPPTKAEGE